MRRKVTKQMLAAGLTVIMLFSALFPVNAFALGGQGNMAGIEGTHRRRRMRRRIMPFFGI